MQYYKIKMPYSLCDWGSQMVLFKTSTSLVHLYASIWSPFIWRNYEDARCIICGEIIQFFYEEYPQMAYLHQSFCPRQWCQADIFRVYYYMCILIYISAKVQRKHYHFNGLSKSTWASEANVDVPISAQAKCISRLWTRVV